MLLPVSVVGVPGVVIAADGGVVSPAVSSADVVGSVNPGVVTAVSDAAAVESLLVSSLAVVAVVVVPAVESLLVSPSVLDLKSSTSD